jgi:hypothetical protein
MYRTSCLTSTSLYYRSHLKALRVHIINHSMKGSSKVNSPVALPQPTSVPQAQCFSKRWRPATLWGRETPQKNGRPPLLRRQSQKKLVQFCTRHEGTWLEWRSNSTHSQPRHLMHVSGKFHDHSHLPVVLFIPLVEAEFSAPVQTCSGAHPVSYTTGTGFLSRG